MQAGTISNTLFANSQLSAFKMEKGFTKPVSKTVFPEIPNDLIDAQMQFSVKCKLTLISTYKAAFEEYVKVGDSIKVYQKTCMNEKKHDRHQKTS